MMHVGNLHQFKLHPRCTGMGLNYLCFVDDVLMFCKDDFQSMFCMIQGLNLFSETFGLMASKEKTAMYYTGMEEGDT